ncbi:MAG: DUF6356 family protein [Steroidobacteraceae bacterium]
MKLQQIFTEHPASVGETYGEHLLHAMSFGSRLVTAGVACIVHALLPFAFITTGSRAVKDLHNKMIVNRASAAATKTRDIATPV